MTSDAVARQWLAFESLSPRHHHFFRSNGVALHGIIVQVRLPVPLRSSIVTAATNEMDASFVLINGSEIIESDSTIQL